MHVSLLASLGLENLDGLMGQALFDLATIFDFDLPSPKGSDSMITPPLSSLLSSHQFRGPVAASLQLTYMTPSLCVLLGFWLLKL